MLRFVDELCDDSEGVVCVCVSDDGGHVTALMPALDVIAGHALFL